MPILPYSQFLLADKAEGSLLATMTAEASTFTFTAGHGARFPASDFCVRVDSETIYVATRTADVCSGLTRGYNGTTAAIHAAEAYVFQSADAALFQRIYDNLAQHTTPKADIPDFAHTHPQGDVTNLTSDLAAKEVSANKNAASGYAGLNGSSKLTGSQQVYGTGANTACEGNDARLSGGGGDLDMPETGSLTVATAKYHLTAKRHSATGSQRITVAGTGRLRIQN